MAFAVSATVVGTRGRVAIPEGFFHTTGFTLVRDGEVEEVVLPRRGNGLGYEAEEVMRCLAAGRTDSELVPLSATVEIMRTLDEIRKLIGVSYPGLGVD